MDDMLSMKRSQKYDEENPPAYCGGYEQVKLPADLGYIKNNRTRQCAYFIF